MCMQCMAGAMTAGAAATGMRAWLAARAPRVLTPRRMRAATVALLGAAFVLAATALGGA
ncbi:MAG: hypothetical protein MUC84_07145 [Solirubrobacteraceae bacterium]|jgi:hypothetical protein|nr:hypothetical protein [Solirubrobacteraceae bacterium]MCU0313818.1 hypothetical protein [Solirubrobacteraceae bacterium]